jgi:isoleucyl-tRNA synthetase
MLDLLMQKNKLRDSCAFCITIMSLDLKNTLNLPQTEFPMRGDLVRREPERIAHWNKLGLYQAIAEKNKDNKSFILHDGPPFTNGDLHLGHALNKTLKDTILRYKWMQGYNAPYIPGWDSHGLPIEYKVSKQLQESGKTDYTVLEVREECAQFADNFKQIQSKQFSRLGVLADWENEYWTIHPEYEAEELRTFAKFIEKDLVYRSKKPVYWSIPCKTALAEAEIEYKNHKSISVYISFALTEKAKESLQITEDASFVIWTTTPWTLPANLAVAVHPEIEYALIQTEKGNLIIAKDLVESTSETCSLGAVKILKTFKGQSLENCDTQHPFMDRLSPVVLADYVTTESGTGCVHTAPGHGLDDYLTGLRYKLEIYCPLDDEGCYVNDGQIPETLIGQSVLEKEGSISDANRAVLKICAENNCLVSKKTIEHSYPHCWRSKTPVIFRAMDQWFIALDKDKTRNKALEQLSHVHFIPEWGEKRMRAAVENRPDWCISRQRAWGVPIPAFYDDDGNAYIDAKVTEKIADKVESEGTNLWFKASAETILDGIQCPADWPSTDKLKCGTDTLDVWIDSGCSHRSVLQKRSNLHSPADLYLEGSDQHRGWFQSSLWTGTIANDAAPFKSILTHGFIVKEDGTKLSKSDGAARPLEEWIKKYGADIIRLWICSQDYRGDVPVSDKIVSNVANNYRTIRNTLRFLIGNLHDFDYEKDAIDLEDLHPIDQWALHQLSQLVEQVTQAYDAYEFHRAFKEYIDPFCANTLSATYHAILKDRLYTMAPNDPIRRSSQTVLYHVFSTFTRLIAPLLPFTADEAYAYFHTNSDFAESSIALKEWPKKNANWEFTQSAEDINQLLKFLNNHLNEKLEALRQEKTIGQSLDAKAMISGPSGDPMIQLLKKYEGDLAELFILSQVEVSIDENGNALEISVAHADGEKCPRSWRWVPKLVDTDQWGPVSPRCKEALEALNL